MLTLTHEHLQQLYRYGYSLTANDQESYDLMYDVIERCIRKEHTPQNPVHYIMRGMRNQLIDQHRRQNKRPHVPLEAEHIAQMVDLSEHGLEHQIISSLDLQKIWPTLEPEEREMLYLWAVEEYTVAEIATHQEKPKNTVLSRLYRLRKRLKKSLTDPQTRAKS